MEKAKLIFDIGKTNKKVMLFNSDYEILFEEEVKFPEIEDDDGFPCDDIEKIESWIFEMLKKIVFGNPYEITHINFSTYGATIVYLDEKGKRCAPVYNYLKPMPDIIKEKFRTSHNSDGDFFRNTASPDLGLLNSGMQIYWLKETKPELYRNVKHILHLPQYISYLITGKIVSDHTSIGCHTAMWDFDSFKYHPWIEKEGVKLPAPVQSDTLYNTSLLGKEVKTGIGIHDSSASLVPYLKEGNEFLLLSTGTWCINMNPFNPDPLTSDELSRDCLCYLSTQKRQVKSSRLFMGHMHDEYLEKLNSFFNQGKDSFKSVKPDIKKLSGWFKNKNLKPVFTPSPESSSIELNQFGNFAEAYNRMVFDLTMLNVESGQLVLPKKDNSKNVYISGGFANNSIFTGVLASYFRGKDVYVSEIKNSSALGAAMAIEQTLVKCDLGLNKITPLF